LVYEKEKEIINTQHNQEMLTAQLEIQEQTMQDIGREIHDNVGQRLTLASIYTNQLSFENQYPLITGRIEAIANIINESLAELRHLSKSLTDQNTETKELAELIQNECDKVAALKSCTISCHFNSSVFVSGMLKKFILRIIQEFIQNSLKHAGCKNINLNFDYNDRGLSILASDDGKGFDMNVYKERSEKGIGILNMKKRAELMGAVFAINSEINKGTTLNLFIPQSRLTA
jgi:signal transduction histidine kinase